MDKLNKTHEIKVNEWYRAFFGENLPMTIARVRLYDEPVKDGLPSDVETIRHYASIELAEKMLIERGYRFHHFAGAEKQIWYGFTSGNIDEILYGARYRQVAELESISVLLEPTL